MRWADRRRDLLPVCYGVPDKTHVTRDASENWWGDRTRTRASGLRSGCGLGPTGFNSCAGGGAAVGWYVMGDTTTPMVRMDGVQKWFGDLHVLQDIEFEV